MKKLLLIFSLLFCLAAGSVNAGAQRLVAEKDAKKGLWGFKERGTDKWKIKPKYEIVTPFGKSNRTSSLFRCFAKDKNGWVLVFDDGDDKHRTTIEEIMPWSENDKYIKIKDPSGWSYYGIGGISGSTGIFKEAPELTSPVTVLEGKDGTLSCVVLGNDYIASSSIKTKKIYKDEIHYAKFDELGVEVQFLDNDYKTYKIYDERYAGKDPQSHILLQQQGDKITLIDELTGEKIGETFDSCKKSLNAGKLSGKGSNSSYGPNAWEYSYENEVPDLYVATWLTVDERRKWKKFATVRNSKTGEYVIPVTLIADEDKPSGEILCLAPDCFWITSNDKSVLYNAKGEKLYEGDVYISANGSGSKLRSYGDYMLVPLKDRTMGIMNNKGEWMIKPVKCSAIYEIVERGKNELSGYRMVDNYGNEVEYSTDFKAEIDPDALHYVSKGNQFAYADVNDKVVTNWYDKEDAVVAAARGGSGQNNYGSGVKRVSRNGKFGLLDTYTGKEVVPCIYDNIGSKAYGMIRVKKNGLCGFLNSNFKLVIPCKYLSVGNFREVFGVAQNPFAEVVISANGSGPYKTGYINKNGVVFETMFTAKRNITLW